MPHDSPPLRDRFRGCLLGLAIGDALGGLFEAQPGDAIRARFPTVDRLIEYPQRELWYTDDTQMMIGVAEALIERGTIVEEVLCRRFVENYVPSRGYGRGARAVLEAMESGEDAVAVAESYFPGGSFGNGAAMRVAPVGLLFNDDTTRLREEARKSALPTHRHQLGIEGAELLALGVAEALAISEFDRGEFFVALLVGCQSDEYRMKLRTAERVERSDELATLGNGIEAAESVPTAIGSFALTPHSFEHTVGNVIFLGGDTDTIAAMAGAVSGAYLGAGAIPARLLTLLEDGPQGRRHIEQLADKLWEASVERRNSVRVEATPGA